MNIQSLLSRVPRGDETELNGRDKHSVSRLLWVTTVILLIVSSAFNVLLSLKARDLRFVIDTLKTEGSLTVGTQVPSIVGEDLNGRPTTIRFSDTDKPTLIYVFTPTCGWCQKERGKPEISLGPTVRQL